MKKLLFAAIAFIGLNAAAQTKTYEDANAHPRTLTGEFNAISVATGVELHLTQGNETALAVSISDEQYIDRFITKVENGVLKIYFDNEGMNWKNFKNRKLKAYLSFKSIEKLTASSGASVQTENQLDLNKLDMKLSSGASFKGQVKIPTLEVDQSSGSVVQVSGTVANVSIDVSSGAIFKGYDLSTENCEARASSGGIASVTINKELNAKASSGGMIHYKGTATIKDVNVSSGGSVKKG